MPSSKPGPCHPCAVPRAAVQGELRSAELHGDRVMAERGAEAAHSPTSALPTGAQCRDITLQGHHAALDACWHFQLHFHMKESCRAG